MQSEKEELAVISYGWPELQWALSVLHSRCFTVGDPVVHLTSPGISNHSVNPNATVRWVFPQSGLILRILLMAQSSLDSLQSATGSNQLCYHYILQ